MSFQHFKSLLLKYAGIERAIEDEHKRKNPDGFRLLKLKKLRLEIKDRMRKLAYPNPEQLVPVRVRSARR